MGHVTLTPGSAGLTCGPYNNAVVITFSCFIFSSRRFIFESVVESITCYLEVMFVHSPVLGWLVHFVYLLLIVSVYGESDVSLFKLLHITLKYLLYHLGKGLDYLQQDR